MTATSRRKAFTVAGAPERVSAEDGPATLARPDAGTDARPDARPSLAGLSVPRSGVNPRDRARHIRDVQTAAHSLRAALSKVDDRVSDLLTELDRATGVLGPDEVTGILALAGITRDMITPRGDE